MLDYSIVSAFKSIQDFWSMPLITIIIVIISFPRVRRVEICKTPDQEKNE